MKTIQNTFFSAFENAYTMMTNETFNTRGRVLFYIGIDLMPTPLDREKVLTSSKDNINNISIQRQSNTVFLSVFLQCHISSCYRVTDRCRE